MHHTRTAAIIDIGSNSIKLLIARRGSSQHAIETVFAKTLETRISAGISRKKPSLLKKSMAAGLQSICDLLQETEAYKLPEIRLVATSAVRDALNGKDFVELVFKKTGHTIKILNGQEEAHYIGQGLACDPQIQGIENFLQMDLGGGSLECIRFEANQIQDALSLQLGSVRLSEAFITDKKASLTQAIQNAIQQQVKSELETSSFNFSPKNWPLIITGGAATVTRAVLAAQNGYSFEDASSTLTLEQLKSLRQQLAVLPLQERMQFPHLPSRRADILPTALLTIEAVLEYSQRTQVQHSLYNLRYGIANNLLSK